MPTDIPPAVMREAPPRLRSQEFLRALARVRINEGEGLSRHPRDPGGLTNSGLTQYALDEYNRTHSAQPISTQLRALSPHEIQRVYYDIWEKSRAPDLTDPRAQLAVFDYAVHSGPFKARQRFERAGGDVATLNALRRAELRRNPLSQHFPGWQTRMRRVQRDTNPPR